MPLIVCLSEGQTILHQVADQAADRDPFIRLEIEEAPEKKISMIDARDNELILSGANYGRAKVSSVFKNCVDMTIFVYFRLFECWLIKV